MNPKHCQVFYQKSFETFSDMGWFIIDSGVGISIDLGRFRIDSGLTLRPKEFLLFIDALSHAFDKDRETNSWSITERLKLELDQGCVYLWFNDSHKIQFVEEDIDILQSIFQRSLLNWYRRTLHLR